METSKEFNEAADLEVNTPITTVVKRIFWELGAGCVGFNFPTEEYKESLTYNGSPNIWHKQGSGNI